MYAGAKVKLKRKDSEEFYTFDRTGLKFKIKKGETIGYCVLQMATGNVYDDDGSYVYTILGTSYVDYSEIDNSTYSLNGEIYQNVKSHYAVGFLPEEINEAEAHNIAFSIGTMGRSELVNDGDVEIPLRIKVKGFALNPSIMLVEKNSNEVVQFIKINEAIPSGAYLEINSDAENTGIWLVYESTGVVTDFTHNVDISTNMYARLPIGNWEIRVADEADSAVQSEVLYSKEYFGA